MSGSLSDSNDDLPAWVAMMNYLEARRIAQEYIDQLNGRHLNNEYTLVIRDEVTIERDFGWVFFYDAGENKAIQQGEDIFSTGRPLIAGNAPVIISRNDGSMHITGTAFPVEVYLKNFEMYGTCYPEAKH